MANNLVMTGDTYGTGKFNTALLSGSGSGVGYPASNIYTIECWIKTALSGGSNNRIFISMDTGIVIYMDVNGRLQKAIPGSGFTADNTTPLVNDNTWHHVRAVGDGTNEKLYLDGNLILTTVGQTLAAGKLFTIGRHQNFAGFDWNAGMDEVAVWSTALNSTNFTPPTAPYVGGASGLYSLYHLDGNGLDNSAAATAPSTMIAPTASGGNASATVSLTAPANGGSTITGYTVTSIPSGGVDSNANTTSLSHVVTGLTNGTAYTFTATATNAVGTSTASPASNSVTPASTSNNALTGATGNVLFSPYNWNVQANTAKTICSGAYFRTIFGGTSCSLQFDTSGLTAPYSKLEYRVDGTGPFTTVDLAAIVPISIPSETSTYPSHFLEFNVRSSGRTNRGTLGGMIALTGILLDVGKTLSLPPRYPLNILVQGDSITEAFLSLFGGGDNVAGSNAMQSYATVAAKYIGAEIGIMGFAGQGFSNPGDGGLPAYPSTYNTIYPGVSQTWLPVPDLMAMNEGTNDGTNNIVSQVTTVLNGWITNCPTSKKVVFRPFNGNQAANLQAGIAACSAPSTVTYYDTTGVFNTVNSPDGLHPNGFEHETHIGPAVGNKFKSIISGNDNLSTRTVSVTLGLDASTAAANLTGLKVSFFDEASPDLQTVARFKTSAGTTNSTGVCTFTVQSTLASGGTGYVVIQGANALHYNGPVVVS